MRLWWYWQNDYVLKLFALIGAFLAVPLVCCCRSDEHGLVI
jgi:hypothetical protein